jgi:3-methyladenine DNA glycosylase/8-oxoguanine DNA glycosylase
MEALQLSVPKPFDFVSTICGHGWVALAPCRWDAEQCTFQRIERLQSGQVVQLQVIAVNAGRRVRLTVHVHPHNGLSTEDIEELRTKIIWMLRLEEDFAEFYRLAQHHPHLYKRVRRGAGRLLRSPTLFEDVVKTICTTNTTWTQTKGMIQRLVDQLGASFPLQPSLHAFPTPAQIATASLQTLQTDIRLGYRAEYIFQLACTLAAGAMDLESLKHVDWPTAELKRTLKKIKGVGEYAANTLLMILGRYEEIAIDSEMRNFVSRRYFQQSPVSDAQIRSVYAHWGQWKYLAYWFEAD